MDIPDSIKTNINYFWVFIVPYLQKKKQNLNTVFKDRFTFKDNMNFVLQWSLARSCFSFENVFFSNFMQKKQKNLSKKTYKRLSNELFDQFCAS